MLAPLQQARHKQKQCEPSRALSKHGIFSDAPHSSGVHHNSCKKLTPLCARCCWYQPRRGKRQCGGRPEQRQHACCTPVSAASEPNSHGGVLGAAAALRHCPIDVLLRRLDRAALAMHAVLCIDLQLRLALLIRHVFVNLRGAEAALRPVVDRQRDLQRHLRLLWLHLQVRGLVVLVVHTAPDQVIKDFECVNAVRLWVLNLLALSSRLRVLGVLLAPLEGPRLHAPREHERRGAIGHARHHAQMPGWLEVPHGVELFPNPRVLDTVLVKRQLHGGRALAQQSLRGGLAREGTGLQGRVAALDLRHVEEACSATSDHAAREGQLRNRLDAALVQDPGAIVDASAPLQKCLHTRVQLELLELLVRAQVGVRVV
mmetsp:Transcript_42816/g.122451  ORF Transcript_42816/g.122451 Transcript_42816/m.122451 type:complete len:372 (+) Transcript_42816:74-1189(+)